ncbi:MAG: sugar ABC transporter ATP-binding protein, partial [Acetobacteraceae bacterium]
MNPAAIVARGISKRFGGVQALEGVTFGLGPGEVHALLGANGAGKSTLIGILSGAIAPDRGSVEVAGQLLPPGDIVAAKRAGVMVVHQELMLFPDLTVEDNVAASKLPLNRALLLDRRQLRARAASVLTSLGLPVAPSRKVGDLSLAQQQIVEIGRAVFGGGRVLILDEPTSALSQPETLRLLNVIHALAQQGVAVVFVSHRLDEAIQIAERITVLRDGMVQGTWGASETDLARVTRAMVGEFVATRRSAAVSTGDVVLSVQNVRGAEVGPVTFDLHEGEILGLIGLEGSGTDVLLRMLGGAVPCKGEILLQGEQLRLRHPADALRAGLVYMPPDRKREGLWLERSPIWNIATAMIRRTAPLGWPGSSA